ncbi:helix-hairpin-helix protein [Thiogranum longum]|uniref:Helix-hairpin-helix protein n=1 Tax=Thiogranum longum TaxID=1537524 RepID=A0A4R1H679_9GAMM|nr:helix-hairpin-helix domain-containing protein [Thiogranum longum]TCK17247.1 helix-hairpin-helix protein [Thiogranum longum]
MQDHEFYADPTVFDYWQGRCSSLLCRYSRNLSPYGWTLAFSVMAIVFAATAVGVFGWTLTSRMSGEGIVAWNQSMAQVITIMMALLACQASLQQALRSWPQDIVMPYRLRRFIHFCGWKVPGAAQPTKTPQGVRRSSARAAAKPVLKLVPGGDDVQVFFAGVRAAGVNVAIARALFSAGVRTPKQLCAASDEYLLTIRGVGSATVRKLRRHFDCD